MNVPDFSDYKRKNKKDFNSLFISTEAINSPIGKEYNIFHYISPKIKNENKIFEIINLLDNKNKFIKEKEIYEAEKRKIDKQIFAHKDNKLEKINLNTVNINTFDKAKLNLDLPQLTIEENFMVEMIKFNIKKKIKEKKKIEEDKKRKCLYLKSFSQDDILSKFSTENTKKIKLKDSKNKNFIKDRNFLSNNYKNSIIKNENNKQSLNNDNIGHSSNINNSSSLSLKLSQNFRRNNNNIHFNTTKLFFSKNKTKLNKSKKFLSCTDFLDKIKSINLYSNNKLPSSIKINFNSSQNLNTSNKIECNHSDFSNNSRNKEKKLKLNIEKDYNNNLFKELCSNIFNVENIIIKNTNEINNNLLDIKSKKYLHNANIDNNALKNKLLKRKNKYK